MTAILGGGISGLSAAYYALENPHLGSVVLYEASNRLGGWIKSKKTSNGTVFEKGPRTIRPKGIAGQNTLILANKLGLGDKIIPIGNKHPATSKRLIYVNEELHILPNSLTSLFKVNSPFNRRLVSVLWQDLFTKKVPKDDESIYSFVERRFGEDVADYLISPMICGICAGNAKDISVKFLLKPAFEFEQKYGSVFTGLLCSRFSKKNIAAGKSKSDTNKIDPKDLVLANKAKRQRWASWILKGGLEEFPRTLEEKLKANRKVDILKKKKCEEITFKNNYVELKINGKVAKYSRVVSSLLAKDLAPLLKRQHPQLSRELEAIPTVDVAVINLRYSGNVLPMEAFGFLVAPKEKLPILGVIFDSCLQDTDSTVLTVMMGGAWFQNYFGNCSTNEHLLSVAQTHVNKILKINESPLEYDVEILKDCIPQYVIGHSARLQRIQNYIKAHNIPLSLCGSSYQGVGLNEVILHI